MVRALLICLLALALPMQGAVAAAIVFCGPQHHDAACAAAAAPRAGSAPLALAALSAVADAHGQAEGLDADETAASAKSAAAGLHKCSACAACCVPAAILQAPAKPPLVEPAAANFATLVPTVERYAASGPDRPPRPVPA